MKFLSALVALLYATLVATNPLSLFGSDQAPLEDNPIPVPGDNPLTYCADPTDFILSIDYVNLSPNPPTPGVNLSITAAGTFAKDVEAGAKVLLQIKYGLITLIKQEADLCDQIGNVDLSCPLKKGPMEFTKNVEIPAQVPAGKYTVMADVYTVNKEKVTCLQSTVFF